MELAIIAMHRAVKMATEFGRFRLTLQAPTLLFQRLKDLASLRNAYEHIDERALGKSRREGLAEALTVFEFRTLFSDRRVTYAGVSLGIDEEATDLLLATRSHILAAWAEFCHRNRPAAEATAGSGD